MNTKKEEIFISRNTTESKLDDKALLKYKFIRVDDPIYYSRIFTKKFLHFRKMEIKPKYGINKVYI